MSHLDKKLTGPVYEFGRFRLDVAERQLLRAGEPLRLPPKVFDLLVVLVEHNGRLLDKEELMARVWPDSYVEEGNINRNISTLRRTLNGDGEEFIETVPKRGYRFVAPVRALEQAEEIVLERRVQTRIVAAEEINEAEPEADVLPPAPIDRAQLSLPMPSQRFRWKSLALIGVALALAVAGSWGLWRWRERPAAQQINTVAILPFKFLGTDKAEEYLGLGLTDTLITRLASLKPNFIRPTSAVLKYQKDDRDVLAAGRALRVDTVLDGYVQKFGEMVSVRLQLIRVVDGALLSTVDYARPNADLLILHDAVTKQVAQALALKLTAEQQQQHRYRDNTAAYAAYLKGRYYWNRRGPDWHAKAIEAFEQAITLDPQYALAYTGLADTYIVLGDHSLWRPKDAFPKAKDAAVRALQIDATLAEAHTSLAHIKARYEWDWQGAEQACLRAIELNPGYALAYGWHGLFLTSLRRFDEALSQFKQAQQLDPLSPSLFVYESNMHRSAGRYDQALAQARKALDLDPDFATAYHHLGLAYLQKGMIEDAIAAYRKADSLGIAVHFHLGYIHAVAGQRQKALKLLFEMQALASQRYVRPYGFAVLYAGLGEKEKAFEWLNRGLADHDTFMSNLAIDQRLDSLRSDTRFAVLLQHTGLPAETLGTQ